MAERRFHELVDRFQPGEIHYREDYLLAQEILDELAAKERFEPGEYDYYKLIYFLINAYEYGHDL